MLSVRVNPAAVTFLSTYDTAAAISFVNNYVANTATLAGVAPSSISLAFAINGATPIPASIYTGVSGRRLEQRKLQTLSVVVIVATILMTGVGGSAVAASVQSNLNAQSVTAMTTALNVQVLSVAAVVSSVVVYPPPPPPITTGSILSLPPPPLSPTVYEGEIGYSLIITIVVAIGGSIVGLAICIYIYCTYYHLPKIVFTQQPVMSPGMQMSPTGAQRKQFPMGEQMFSNGSQVLVLRPKEGMDSSRGLFDKKPAVVKDFDPHTKMYTVAFTETGVSMKVHAGKVRKQVQDLDMPGEMVGKPAVAL